MRIAQLIVGGEGARHLMIDIRDLNRNGEYNL